MIELLTLIALWCGNPVPASPNHIGTWQLRTAADVKTCRAAAVKCLDDAEGKVGYILKATICISHVPY